MMAKFKNVRSLVALTLIILVTLLSVSIFSLGVAATDAETTVATDETTVAAETTAVAETTATDETTAAGTTEDEDDEGLGLGFWISMGVLVILVAVGAFFAVKHRAGLAKWLRSYKSELKKVVWMPWPEVRKSTVVVIVVVVVIGALIAMLDFVFSKGIIALGNLI